MAFPNIMSMFTQATAPAAPAAPVVPVNNTGSPGNIPAVAEPATVTSVTTAPNGTVPAGTTATAAASPLDAFKDIWNTDTNAASAATPYFNVNMEALQKAAQQQDFTTSITPEHLAAIGAGGEGAIKAFSAALNAVSQDVYARNALATTKIMEQALAKAETKFSNSIPGHIKQHNLQDGLRTENPAFSHPAAQPIISALQQALTTKYPQATAAELRGMATQYLGAFAGVATAPADAVAAAAKGNTGETDWSTFLG